MTILGIDPGLAHTGVAILGGEAPGGVQRRSRTLTLRTDSRSRPDGRLAYLASALLELLVAERPTLVAIEGYGYQGPQRSHNPNASVLPRLVGIFEGLARSEGIPSVTLQRGQILEALCGYASADKATVQKALQRRGFTGPNEHERDAIAVAIIGARHHELLGRIERAQGSGDRRPRDPDGQSRGPSSSCGIGRTGKVRHA